MKKSRLTRINVISVQGGKTLSERNAIVALKKLRAASVVWHLKRI